MPSREAYTHTLNKLATRLRKRDMTALEIARWLGCSKPVAYARLRALAELGLDLVPVVRPVGKTTGPRATAYRLRLERSIT